MSASLRTGLSTDERVCSWFDRLTTSDVCDLDFRTYFMASVESPPRASAS
jgi:hypothetical protein